MLRFTLVDYTFLQFIIDFRASTRICFWHNSSFADLVCASSKKHGCSIFRDFVSHPEYSESALYEKDARTIFANDVYFLLSVYIASSEQYFFAFCIKKLQTVIANLFWFKSHLRLETQRPDWFFRKSSPPAFLNRIEAHCRRSKVWARSTVASKLQAALTVAISSGSAASRTPLSARSTGRDRSCWLYSVRSRRSHSLCWSTSWATNGGGMCTILS